MDPGRKGVIKAKDLWHILVKWGERLSPREGKTFDYVYLKNVNSMPLRMNTLDSKYIYSFSVDQIFREANINPNGSVKYEQFVKIVSAPVPDYY
jgi:Ca2+-binding EF-hand superfamily protein